MNKVTKKFGAIMVAGGVLAGLAVAATTGSTEAASPPATAGPLDPTAGAGSSTSGQRNTETSATTGTSGRAERTERTERTEVTTPAEPVPTNVQDAVAERTMGDGPDGASDPQVTRQLAGQGGQVTLTNTEYSSYGAYIQSAGYCTGDRTGFRATLEGFEWMRLSVYTGTALFIGEWIPVAQVHNEWIPLPIGTPGISYIIDGWDETPYGGDQRTVLTSFTRLPTFNSYWTC